MATKSFLKNIVVKDRKSAEDFVVALENVEKGIGLSKGYTDLDEMWEDLEKED